MNNPLVNQAAMVLPVFLLSACLGGGGSFDLDSVDTEAPRAAPKYQDVPSKKPEARKDQGGYGFAMRFKRRNWYGSTKEDRVKLNESDWEQTDNGGIKNPSKQKSIIDALTGNDGETLQDSSQEGQSISKVEGYHDFKYVWSGFFYKRIGRTIKKDDSSSKIIEVRNGPDGYIFYKGKNPSRQLPVLGQVTYKGTWNFLTDVKANQKFTDLGNTSTKPGDRYSAFSGELDYIVKKEDDKKEKHKGLGLTTEITVDFENKTLKGKLVKNNHVINDNSDDQNKYTTEYYTLDATLRGNRFSGKAMATEKGENKQHPFVSDSSSLSGGFFGPQGEELGFRFLSDDGKVAVVGSAKTGDKAENGGGNGASGGASVSVSNGAAGTSSENGKLTTVLDAVELTPDGKEIKNLDNFSNATRLVVDGIMIPLLPTESGDGQADKGENGKTAFIYETTYTPESDEKNTQAQTGAGGMQTASGAAGVNGGQAGAKTYKVEACCSNLNYLKYGMLTRKNSESAMQAGGSSNQADAKTEQAEQSMFLQGERTPVSDMAARTEANAKYRGTWYGYIANGTSWSGNASNTTSGNKAEFTVNFDKKKITGMLTAANRQEATFTIDAMIESNGFKGMAKTGNGGFAPDQNSSTGTHKVHITSAAVQGGFYGPKAEELGGWFAYPGNGQTKNAQASSGNGNSAGSATVVFGAKRQELVK
ncbi:TPA: transferrin-binding protein-like solute binding protein [Neisseria gonorrhoeae]